MTLLTLVIAVLVGLVWYFAVIYAIGYAIRAWPCRDCLREKIRRERANRR